MKRAIQPVRRDRVSRQIEQQLLALFQEGKLAVGERLPSERELSEMFGVSRPSVREAMRSLERLGVIEARQGGGTFVREPRWEDFASPFAAAIRSHRLLLQQIYEARCVIEPAVGRSAAEHATDEEIAALGKILDRQAEKLSRGESTVDEDTEFHAVITHAAGNPILQTMAEACLSLLQPSREAYLQTAERQATSLRTHRLILDAISRHDPDAAYAASLAHIQATVGEFVNAPAETTEPGEEGEAV